jgi:hypothetical protein
MNDVGKDASISYNAAAMLHAVQVSRAHAATAWRAMALGPAVPHGACMHLSHVHNGWYQHEMCMVKTTRDSCMHSMLALSSS